MGAYLLYSYFFAGADLATGIGGSSFLTLSLGLFAFSYFKFLNK